ncbi:MAG: hypothetical protein FJY97_07655 [candidate division Zixibacteria bacterium]|nr:hypothetical protein [candidate division Zixibacteria bacterium]
MLPQKPTILSQEEFSTLLEKLQQEFEEHVIASGRTVMPLDSFQSNEYAVQYKSPGKKQAKPSESKPRE